MLNRSLRVVAYGMLAAAAMVAAHIVVARAAVTHAAPSDRRVLCAADSGRGGAPGGQPGGIVVGTVRDVHRAPIAGAAVTVAWLELSISASGFHWSTVRRSARSAADGTFLVCGAPAAGTIFLSAAGDGAATDTIGLAIPADSVVRRDLYLAAARRGRLHGVVTTEAGAPIAAAEVAMGGIPPVRTDAAGAWTVSDAPGGTRILQVRAVGFVPVRVAVDVIDGAAPLRVALTNTQAMLDTMRINAARDLSGVNGFAQRRRSAAGDFLTGDEVRRYAITRTSDALRAVPGLLVDQTADGRHLSMRGLFVNRCQPSVFVDGSYLPGMDADEIDAFVDPASVAAIEVYGSADVPPQFAREGVTLNPFSPSAPTEQLREQCGAIVIWRKPLARPPAISWTRDAAAAGVLVGSLLLGFMLSRVR